MNAEPTGPGENAIEIFYSYAHEDEALRKELEKHLTSLQRQGIIAGWHDRLISAGTEWEHQIDSHLNTAGIILLLISASFIASKYCYSIEMKRALERHEARGGHLVRLTGGAGLFRFARIFRSALEAVLKDPPTCWT